MKPWITEETRARTRSNIVVVCVAIVLIASVYYFGTLWGMITSVLDTVLPFMIGFGIAFLLLPIVNRMEAFNDRIFFRKKKNPRLNRMLSTAVAVGVLLALVAGFMSMLVPQLITSVKSILQYARGFISMNSDWINEFLLKYDFLSIEEEKLVIAWENIISQLMSIISDLLNNVTLVMNNLRAIAFGISSGVYIVIFHFLVGLIAAIYLLIDKERFVAQIKKLLYATFQRSTCETLIYWTRRAHKIFAGYITGKVLDSLIIGLICYALMLMFRMDFALLISVIVGVTNIIPYFGPWIGAVPGFIILLLVNPPSALWFLVMIIILQQLDGNVIGPFILRDHVGLSPFWIMMSIVIGGGLFGFPGMLLGVPVFALMYAILRSIIDVRLKERELPISSAAYVNAPEKLETTKEFGD